MLNGEELRDANEYTKNLTKLFGLDPDCRPEVLRSVNELWKSWEEQGISKPNNLDIAIRKPTKFNEEYYYDIVEHNSLILNDIHFFVFPWYEFNAAVKKVDTGEHVILFDSQLMGFLHSITIPIIIWAYGRVSETESEFYEQLIIKQFDSFVNECLKLDNSIDADSFEDYLKVFSFNEYYNIAGSNCAYACICFAICHEIAHIKLGHTNSGDKLLRCSSNGKLVDFHAANISRQQEFEADKYGFHLFLNLIDGYEHSEINKLTSEYKLMPMVYFELMDLVYEYAKHKDIRYINGNTHPEPLLRKERLFMQFDENFTSDNDFYGAFMGFSEVIRKRLFI